MTIRVGETGKRFYVISNYDMTSNTSLIIYGVPPSGEQNQKAWTATIGGALSNVTLEDGTTVTVPANESMYYDFDAGDLDEAGKWTIVGVFFDTATTPDGKLVGAPATLTVLDDNYLA